MKFPFTKSILQDVNDHYALSWDQVEFILTYARELPTKSCLLELGVCHGRTLAALAMIATAKHGRAYGIDNFGLEGSKKEVLGMFSVKGISGATIIVGNTQDVQWDTPIDLLVIDAGHDEANVRPDIEKYVPLVKSGGYVFFDDYDDPKNRQSPHWAVRHYADLACGSWHDLGIVKRSKEDEFGAMRGWRRP